MTKTANTIEDRRKAALAMLPPPNTKRWVARRKASVVAAVANGLLTLEEACARYMLSAEEFASWQHAIDSHGLRGLRTTRLQEYRPRERGVRGPHTPGDENQLLPRPVEPVFS